MSPRWQEAAAKERMLPRRVVPARYLTAARQLAALCRKKGILTGREATRLMTAANADQEEADHRV